MTIKEKRRMAPSILGKLVSPYSSKEEVEKEFSLLLNDGELLNLVIEIANRSSLTPVLFTQLQNYNLDNQLNNDLKAFMFEMTSFMRERNQSLSELTKEIISISNKHDITPMLIKGGATLFSNVYPNTGLRFMLDLDILFKEEDTFKIFWILQSAGFEVPKKYLTYHAPAYLDKNNNITELPYSQHLSPLYRVDDPCRLEIHHRPLSRFFNYFDNDLIFSSSIKIQSLSDENLSALRMSPADEVIYCFAHSELAHNNYKYNKFSLRQMDFFVRLVHCYQDEIDWDIIHSRINKCNGEVAFQHYLYAVNRLFTASFPIQYDVVHIRQLEKRFLKSLPSSFPSDNPMWRFACSMQELVVVLSRQTSFSNSSKATVYSLWATRLKRINRIITMYSSPIKLYKRIFR